MKSQLVIVVGDGFVVDGGSAALGPLAPFCQQTLTQGGNL
jgi:hypothetical protein